MTDQKKPTEDALAEQLRANLRRRKAAARKQNARKKADDAQKPHGRLD